MRLTAITGARLVDPATSHDAPATLLVRNGRVVDRLAPGDPLPAEAERHDRDGLTLLPGLVDTRVFTGQPGAGHRETAATLGAAAVAGGVTTVLAMPDTAPVIDEASLVTFVRETADRETAVNVHPVGALTRGLEGRELAEMGLMVDAGAAALGQGRRPVADAALLRRALIYARDLDCTIDLPLREASLSGGTMNRGAMAGWLGLAPEAHEAETIAAMRETELARGTGARVNLACASLGRTLGIVARAREEGADVSLSCTVNHLSLNETDVGDYRTFFRLEPPLREEDERRALVEGLRAGTIDIVCSAHDPQDADTKRLPFPDAAPGAIGLETMLAALLRLHHGDEVGLTRLVECVTDAPARRFGLDAGSLAVGMPADFVLVDLDEPWVVHEDELRSRSRNTPFEGARLQGRVRETWIAGRRVYSMSDAVGA